MIYIMIKMIAYTGTKYETRNCIFFVKIQTAEQFGRFRLYFDRVM